MRFLHAVAVVALAIPFIGASCSLPGEPESRDAARDGAQGKAASEIIGGALDTTHTAVVAVLGNNFSCSGTIIQVSGNQGYVLTAAHCCVPGNLPNKVVIGNDYNTGTQFNVVPGSVLADSCYTSCPGSTDDVCMLRFSGATGATPVIPAMTPATDALVVGTPITYVGYGLTQPPPGGFNSKRRSVAKTIGKVDPYFVEYANPTVSGTCEGDSGGPGLVTVNGVEQVACVTSFGDQNCQQLGASIRTSKVYTKFIAPYLANQAPNLGACPIDTDCNVCISDATNPNCGGGCANTLSACQNDPACGALLNCYNGCSTAACQDDCNTQHLSGLQQYEGVVSCLCGAPCSTACGANGFCAGNHCGIQPPGASPTCASCMEDACCAVAWTCSTDPNCKKCFTATNPAASCATNAAALAYYQCVNSSCGGSCMLRDPKNAGMTTSATTGAGGAGAGSGGSGGAGVGGSGSTTSTGSGTPSTTESGCTCRTSSSEGDDEMPLALACVVGAIGLGRLQSRSRRSRG